MAEKSELNSLLEMSESELIEWQRRAKQTAQEKEPKVKKARTTEWNRIDEVLALYRQSNTKNWSMLINVTKLTHEQKPEVRESTGESDYEKARRVAEKKIGFIEECIKQGIPYKKQSQVSFKRVAEEYIAQLEKDISDGVANTTEPKIISALRNWIIPFFGEKRIDEFNSLIVQTFFDWKGPKGLAPSRAEAQRNYQKQAIEGVFKTAEVSGYIKNGDSPSLPKKKVQNIQKQKSRWEIFTDNDLDIISNGFYSFIIDRPQFMTRHYRRAAQYYFNFCLNTGMRPGEEPEGIRFEHIAIGYENEETKQGKFYTVEIHKGKTNDPGVNVRRIIIDDAAVEALEYAHYVLRKAEDRELMKKTGDGFVYVKSEIDRLDWLIKRHPKSYVFKSKLYHRIPPYNDIISKKQLFKFLDGKLSSRNYVTYSTRHTYINRELKKPDVTHSEIADYCGTSLEVIEKHYKRIESTLNVPDSMRNRVGQKERTRSNREALYDRDGTRKPEEIQAAIERDNRPEVRKKADDFVASLQSGNDQ